MLVVVLLLLLLLLLLASLCLVFVLLGVEGLLSSWSMVDLWIFGWLAAFCPQESSVSPVFPTVWGKDLEDTGNNGGSVLRAAATFGSGCDAFSTRGNDCGEAPGI